MLQLAYLFRWNSIRQIVLSLIRKILLPKDSLIFGKLHIGVSNPQMTKCTTEKGGNAMTTILKNYFPMIQTREEVMKEISGSERLSEMFFQWKKEQQEAFLDFCTGNRGVKILYDSFFKEILNPEIAPERIEEFLSLILKQEVRILTVLPNDTVRIADEQSLVIMDIVVELEDHSIANVEVQKIGYLFAGQRSACYSADLLLRQYKRVKGEKGKAFSYKDIKKVFTVVLYEKSPKEFWQYPEEYIHHFSQKSDTGIKMELLQEYVYIPLDVFRKFMQNRGIKNKLEAWLRFFSTENPEEIGELIEKFPEFKKLYGEIYELCRNVEKVMEMFSKELQELDRNTVQYMIDVMQEEIDGLKGSLQEKEVSLKEQEAENQRLLEQIKKLEEELAKEK